MGGRGGKSGGTGGGGLILGGAGTLVTGPLVAVQNVPPITGNDPDWAAKIPDTGLSNPIPVQNFQIVQPVGTYTIADGYAFKENGVGYMVAKGGSVTDAVDASHVAESLSIFHDTLPGGASVFQKDYTWVSAGRNPADAYWARQYNMPGFRSAAMASDGHTTLWDPIRGLNYDKDLRHEFGHNVSSAMTSHGLGANGAAWRTAAAAPRGKVYNFTPTWSSFPITTRNAPTALFPAGVTTYGRSSIGEDYAESISLYLSGILGTGRLRPGGPLQPITFADLFPARARILYQILGPP